MALPEMYGEGSSQTANYARYGIEFVRGDGAYLLDDEDVAYLDLLCGLGVTSLGHAPKDVVKAINKQAGQLIHTSNLFWTEPAELLARKLTRKSFGDKVFFCNSGAEANEAAIKLARAHAHFNENPAREIVVLERAFHGRTLGALSATPQEDKQAPFAPLVGGFRTAPNDDANAVSAAITPQTCAVMLEPVQGEGGVFTVPDDVLIAAREACDAVGALLIFDEVQCGLGRTGSLFAYEQTPVVPDVMTLAKALASGLPIGAMVATDEVATSLKAGLHGSTFGGNPVSCAAAIATLDVLEKKATLDHANLIAADFRARLARFGELQGRGLMIGLELSDQVDAKQLVQDLLFEDKIITNATGPHTLRLLPPLICTHDDVDVLEEALEKRLPS
jgi:predicted acetylornithine/succinylornithine family transaminase